MKKSQRAQLFLQNNAHFFRCPLCQQALHSTASGLACRNGHSFDLSKKGSLYFLPHQIKTDYDTAMLSARGRMIQRGIFQPLVTLLQDWLPDDDPLTIDVGCGEGGFLAQLGQARPSSEAKIGFDISKDGVYLATGQPLSNAFWCIADLTNLPFADQQASTILNIFSPSHYREFQRVLRPNGHLLKVIPEAHYLQELRQHFLPGDKIAYSNQRVLDHLAQEMTIDQQTRLTYTYQLPDAAAFADLMQMSPLEWQATTAQKTALAARPFSAITIDLLVIQAH
ncbi:putative RNA methyltransferase [Lapidilactobacillus luobeiensis]|uniref:putative RNA methyltransferase n=1 Tax=Lapidilactobacillus luobeiensis TaxID=2950371 RepID=UPI0021C3FB9A|nr:methyltransferase domain-containing protein [Lapidilactobacillus luobeiensis]